MKKFALICAIFLSSSFAMDIVGCGAGSIQDLNNAINRGTAGLIPVLAFATIVALAIIYMFASAFNRQEYIVLVKDEFFHLGVSFAILILFGMFMGLGCTLVSSSLDFAYSNIAASSEVQDACYANYQGNNAATPQDIASCYMRTMERDAKRLINIYTKSNIDYQIDASAYVSYYGLLAGVTYAPEGYKRTQAMFIDNLNNIFVLPAYVSIVGQNILVRFFIKDENSTSAILNLLLPAAFILRFFPPLRQIGNMLIAFSVGLYLVIPVFIALNGIMYKYVFTFAPNGGDCAAYYQDVITDPISRLGDCSNPGNLLHIARLYPQAFLLPNLVIIVFISFISAANKALKVFG